MNLWHLKIFQAVAAQSSYTKAAETLRISQSAVSHEIRSFEKWLGIKLFDHLGKQIHLTEAGALLEDYARRIFLLVDDAHQAINDLKGLSRGRLRLGASTTPGIYWLPGRLGKFQKEYPHITLSLKIGNTATIEQMALNDEIDLGIVGKKPLNKDLYVEPIRRDRLVLIVPKESPLANRRKVSLSTLQGESFILREPGSATRALVQEELDKAGIDIKVVIELGSTEAIKCAVTSGLGLAIISQHACANGTGAAGFRQVNLVEPVLEREFFLIYRKRKHLSAATRAFITIL